MFYIASTYLENWYIHIYSWSVFWFLLITEGVPSRLRRNSSFAFRNHLFGILTIFETNFRIENRVRSKMIDRVIKYFSEDINCNISKVGKRCNFFFWDGFAKSDLHTWNGIYAKILLLSLLVKSSYHKMICRLAYTFIFCLLFYSVSLRILYDVIKSNGCGVWLDSSL